MMSNTAFRKDDSVLATLYGVSNGANRMKAVKSKDPASPTSTKHTSIKAIRQAKSSHKKKAAQMKVVRLSLDAKDRVPQAINVKWKKYNDTSASTRKRRTMNKMNKMNTQPANKNKKESANPNTETKTNPAEKIKVTTNSKPNTKPQKSKSKSKSKGGDMKTLTINTQATSSATDNLVKTPNVIKPTKGTARYLTAEEVNTYRTGLHKHIEQKGGSSFVQEQQKTQQKKHPGFHFDDIVDTKNSNYETIKTKLQLSAKNRNALRRVKREILKSFGGHRTFKNLRKLKNTTGNSQTPSTTNYKGSMYTRKSAGGKALSTPTDVRVTWKDSDSLGDTLRDESSNDMRSTEGLSTIDLSGLEEVVID